MFIETELDREIENKNRVLLSQKAFMILHCYNPKSLNILFAPWLCAVDDSR